MKAKNPSVLPNQDLLYLFNEGTYYHAYQTFGAHPSVENGEAGVRFTVWAPGVRSVRIAGDYNGWQEDGPSLAPVGSTGVWTGFVPGIAEGTRYKYLIETSVGEQLYKADPFAFYAEQRPCTASIVHTLDYTWHDKRWMEKRARTNHFQTAKNIYEVHLGSWRQHKQEQGPDDPSAPEADPDDTARFYTYRELAETLVPYVRDMGYTHIELLPVMEHPFDGSWGYQLTGYYAATSRYGTPQDLMYLIDCAHRAGIGVILDWVPGHFCRDSHGLGRFNGEMLYEKDDHKQWGTYKFDFGRNEVRSFLLSNAMFWLDRYHVDGIRVDGVSSMLYLNFGVENPGEKRYNRNGGEEDLEAVAFLQEFSRMVGTYFPGVFTVAEESSAWPLVTAPPENGGLGFHYKWDMGWMNDTLDYCRTAPAYRGMNYHKLTFSMMYYYHDHFLLPLSHDEVVHGKATILQKMNGQYEKKFPQARILYMYMYAHPGKKLNFMGNEIGQLREWDEKRQQDWNLLDFPVHREFHRFMMDLNHIYLQHLALSEKDYDPDGFRWLDCHQEERCIYAFERIGSSERIIAVFNFSNCEQIYQLKVRNSQTVQVLLSSNWVIYGGDETNYGANLTTKNNILELTMKPYTALYMVVCSTNKN